MKTKLIDGRLNDRENFIGEFVRSACMKSFLVFLLLHFGIFLRSNGEFECKDGGTTKCCYPVKPMSCAYITPAEARNVSACNCLPRDNSNLLKWKACNWSTVISTKNGSVVPCSAFGKEDCVLQPGVLPDIECNFGYPPQAAVMHEHESEYCDFNHTVNGSNTFLPQEMIYDVFFTCWLYNCGNRLEIPNATIAKTGKLQWCYPPVLPQGPFQKYCDLYTINQTYVLYDASTIGRSQAISEQLCVLPPICMEGTNKVNRTRNMIPWIKNTANETYCEVLCERIGKNNGISSTGRPCRRRPSCATIREPVDLYNKYQIPDLTSNCRPWCSVPESRRKIDVPFTCNQIPLCTIADENYTDSPDVPYTENNPYGHQLCIKPNICKGRQSPETHHCYTNVTADKFAASEILVSEFPSKWLGILFASFFVVVIFATIALFLFLQQRKLNRRKARKLERVFLPTTPTTPPTPSLTVSPVVTPVKVEPRRAATNNGQIGVKESVTSPASKETPSKALSEKAKNDKKKEKDSKEKMENKRESAEKVAKETGKKEDSQEKSSSEEKRK